MTVISIKVSTTVNSKGSTGTIPPSTNWILKDGVWDDTGVWEDDAAWNDGT